MRPTWPFLCALLIAAQRAGAGTPIDWSAGVPYAYDPSGNITAIGTDTHSYDVAGRVVQSDTGGIRRTFSYDAFGNRKTCSQEPATDCQYGHTVISARNQLSGTTYDGAGNVEIFEGHQYHYDSLNRLTARDLDTEYLYTADDERIATHTTTSDIWRWTLRDGAAKVIRELTSVGASNWTWSKDYVWRGNELLASRQIEPGATTPGTYHYHLDHLGTPRRITDDADAIVGVHDYHAFGPETSGGTNEPSLSTLEYTGHERDTDALNGAATLDYMHARYTSGAMGRFMAVDPKNGAKPAEPQSWNRYAYALNNPLKYIDPDGKDVWIVVTNIVVDDTYVRSRKHGGGVAQQVPAYRIVVMNQAEDVDLFAGSRDTNYAGNARKTRGGYGSDHEAPPGEYFGKIRTGGTLGDRVELSDTRNGDTIVAPDGTRRQNVQIHVGPGCSQGCVLLTGKATRDAFIDSVKFLQEREREAGRSDQLHVVVQARNVQECSGDHCDLR